MVKLFGGAIVASVPSAWRDVSQVRQVPDNQEVYQDCTEETGAVLVIEILDYQSDVQNDDACNFFLKDLADANEVEEQQIQTSQVVNLLENHEKKSQLFTNFDISSLKSHNIHACIAEGSQKVVQGKGSTKSEPRWIDIEICVLRLEHIETDLLITLSTPRNEKNGGEMQAEYSAVFKQAVGSFNIKDWDLFG